MMNMHDAASPRPIPVRFFGAIFCTYPTTPTHLKKYFNYRNNMQGPPEMRLVFSN